MAVIVTLLYPVGHYVLTGEHPNLTWHCTNSVPKYGDLSRNGVRSGGLSSGRLGIGHYPKPSTQRVAQPGFRCLHRRKVLQQITVGSLIDRFLEVFEPRRAKKGSLGILKTGLGHFFRLDY